MELKYIFLIIVVHWIADFVMQRGDWAVNKSKEPVALLKHTATYSLVWYIVLIHFFSLHASLFFTIVTFCVHTLTDMGTSKWVRAKFNREELGSDIPNMGAFSVIGLDQVLHYIQLFLTLKFIMIGFPI